MDSLADYQRKRDQAARQLIIARQSGSAVGLRKSTSNLFRHRAANGKSRIDGGQFGQVIAVDPEQMIADVEGMTAYETLVDATLPMGLMPAVVPQLKTITVGGAVSGLGIESSSFRYGLVHETVEEMEILLGNGEVVVCSRNTHADLFYGFPNSYGTLGYVLRLKVRLIPIGPALHLTHTRSSDPGKYFENLLDLCADSSIEFLDGTIFSGTEMYLTAARAHSSPRHLSNYEFLSVYYKSIRERREDWLSARSYIWRWDTDWFWCSKQFHVQHPAVRALTWWALGSRNYQRLMRLSNRFMAESATRESVIQDVDIPIEKAPEFCRFLLAEVPITPIWMCPFRTLEPFPLTALQPGRLYINFGFWDSVPAHNERGYTNRKIEDEVRSLEGVKALYSTSYYDEATFWSIYDRAKYEALRRNYHADGIFPDLFSKAVLRK